MRNTKIEKELKKALEKFLNDGDTFEKAIASSTKAGYAGSGYSVELLPNGRYRVLWDNQIGNKYVSHGAILAIPQLPDDYAEDTEDKEGAWTEALEFYADEWADEMRDKLDAALELRYP